jgi:hypothetical protein
LCGPRWLSASTSPRTTRPPFTTMQTTTYTNHGYSVVPIKQ